MTEDSEAVVEAEEDITLFTTNEIEYGDVLGKGGFCTVYLLKNVKLKNDENEKEEKDDDTQQSSNISDDEDEFFTITQDRSYIKSHCVRKKDNKCRYAIKKLNDELFSKDADKNDFECGVCDIEMELKFLRILRHPHIITLRAMAEDSNWYSKDYFIVMDRLEMTLTDKLTMWKKQVPGVLGGVVFSNKKMKFFMNRLKVAYDVCSGISYMHEKKIIYRDLKPGNIGFDMRDEAKIFDFGLTIEMTDDRRHEKTDTYNFTRDTGSPRYMAPEVFQGVPYNEKCDIYSIGLIIWQCLQLDYPFSSFDHNMLVKKVYNGDLTPELNHKWSHTLRELLTNCFSRDFSKRYSCAEVMTILDEEFDDIHCSSRCI